MGQIREFDYVTGIETSTPPTSGTPSADADLVTKGYADDTYTRLDNVLGTTDTIANLRAFLSTDADRVDDQIIVVVGTGATYAWDSASTATDDGDAVVKPNDNPVSGRWLKISAGGGGGSSLGGSGLESLIQKSENEKYGIITEDLDNSIQLSGFSRPLQKSFMLRLLKGQSATNTTIQAVINPKVLNDADPNYESISGWTAVGAGTNLTATTTAGEFYIGSAALKFDKNNSATRAGIRFDRTVQDLSIAKNVRVFAKVKLPSITGLSGVYIRFYSDSTSNFREFLATTQEDGSALQVGENTIVWDVSMAGSIGGTPWDYKQLSRYSEVGVYTTSASQTYTGIIFDSVAASYSNPEELGLLGAKWTLHDDSYQEGITISSSNTKSDGTLTLASGLAHSYKGGFDDGDNAFGKRSTMEVAGGVIPMDNDAGLSGEVTTQQQVRFGKYLRSTVSGNAHSFVDVISSQNYKVATVGGSTIDVTDYNDQHLDLVSGDVMDVFRPFKLDGKIYYKFLFSRSLTANSSHSSNLTTLTMTTASIQAGDVICKRPIDDPSVSLVAVGSDENYATMMAEDDPDGTQLIEEGFATPNPGSLWGEWLLGGQNEVEALREQSQDRVSLIKVGTPNLGQEGPFGEFAATGFSSSGSGSLLYIPYGYTDLDANAHKVQISFFFRDRIGFTGISREMISRHNALYGYFIRMHPSQNTLAVCSDNASRSTEIVYAVGGWVHVFMKVINGGTSSKVYLDGIGSALFDTPVTAGDSGSKFTIGAYNTVGTDASVGIDLADIKVWVDGRDITDAEILGLAKNPRLRLVQRYRHKLAGQSGQRFTMEVPTKRTTTAIATRISKSGLILL